MIHRRIRCAAAAHESSSARKAVKTSKDMMEDASLFVDGLHAGELSRCAAIVARFQISFDNSHRGSKDTCIRFLIT